MTKSEIDYSNTVIYKITCNEPNVTDKYVGHTTNFVQRKSSHKNSTTNEKSDCYNLKLYKTIRENGGWENWRMEMVYFYNCKNLHEAKLKEQEYFIELKATLNSIEPVKTKHIDTVKTKHVEPVKTKHVDKIQESNLQFNHSCQICDFKCCKPIDWRRHLKTNKHIGRYITTKKSFECKICSFTCSKQSAYNAHLNTKKHATCLLRDVTPLPECEATVINEPSNQIMSKIGLAEFIHPDYMDIIKQLLCQNNELKNFIIEQTQDYKKETTDILNRVIEQASEHKKDTLDIITKVIEMKTSNNKNNDYAVIL